MPPARSAQVASARADLAGALERVERRLREDGYRGYDPYDALTSPLFSLPGFRSSKTLRLGAQQVLKRLPVNVRPLLAVPKGYNPVTLALALHAYAHLAGREPGRAGPLAEDASFLVAELGRLARRTPHGVGWGYDFPWQTRYEFFPAHTPTIVATGIVTDALVAAHAAFGERAALDLCVEAAGFVEHDLNRVPGAEGFCWSYSPLDRQPVLNATAKGARLLAQVAVETGRDELTAVARETLRYVAAHQRDDGAWPYAIDDPRSWSDNFHTGYVLDAMHEYGLLTGDTTFDETVRRGWGYYRGNFFVDDRIPKYYDHELLPVDSTAVAQSLMTLTRFGDTQTASNVATWAIEHLQLDDGSFAYQRRRRYTIRIRYTRWSTAWMFCGLAHLAAA